jgi:hypothetical protein
VSRLAPTNLRRHSQLTLCLIVGLAACCSQSMSAGAQAHPTPSTISDPGRLSARGCKLASRAPKVPFPSTVGVGPVYAAGGGFNEGVISAGSLTKVLVVVGPLASPTLEISVVRLDTAGVGFVQFSASARQKGTIKTIQQPNNQSVVMSTQVELNHAAAQSGDYWTLPSYLYVEVAGCYGYQARWTGGAEVLYFEAGGTP